MNVVVAGNFQVTPLSMTPGFQHTGTWYDYFSGSSIEVSDLSASVDFEPGEYHLWTDVPMETPDNILAIHEAELPAPFDIIPNPGIEAELVLHAPLDVPAEIQLFDLTGRMVSADRLPPGFTRVKLPSHTQAGPMLVRLVSPLGNSASYWLKSE